MNKVSHMIPFELEKADWKKCYEGLRRFWLQNGIMDSSLLQAIDITKKYSERKFPAYQMHAFPTSFQATDSIVIWREAGKILLGRKKNESLWRFPGGFVDPNDTTLEKAASRELKEECHIGFGDEDSCLCSYPQYIGSFRVPDPRYEHGPDKIMSAVFKSYYIMGKPMPGDDLKWVRWVTKDYLRRKYKSVLMPCHHPLAELVIASGLL